MLIDEWDRLCGEAGGVPSERQEQAEVLLDTMSAAILTSEPTSLAHVFAVALLTYDAQSAAHGAAGNYDAERGVWFRTAALCELARKYGLDGELPNALRRLGGVPLARVKVAA